MSRKAREHHDAGHAGNAGHAELRGGLAMNTDPARQKVSNEERSRLIQDRAYDLWEHAGKPVGDAAREQFWLQAEKEYVASHAKDE
jgi:hypothetical protein